MRVISPERAMIPCSSRSPAGQKAPLSPMPMPPSLKCGCISPITTAPAPRCLPSRSASIRASPIGSSQASASPPIPTLVWWKRSSWSFATTAIAAQASSIRFLWFRTKPPPAFTITTPTATFPPTEREMPLLGIITIPTIT